MGREIPEQVGEVLVEFGVCGPNEHSRCRRISDRWTRPLYIARGVVGCNDRRASKNCDHTRDTKKRFMSLD